MCGGPPRHEGAFAGQRGPDIAPVGQLLGSNGWARWLTEGPLQNPWSPKVPLRRQYRRGLMPQLLNCRGDAKASTEGGAIDFPLLSQCRWPWLWRLCIYGTLSVYVYINLYIYIYIATIVAHHWTFIGCCVVVWDMLGVPSDIAGHVGICNCDVFWYGAPARIINGIHNTQTNQTRNIDNTNKTRRQNKQRRHKKQGNVHKTNNFVCFVYFSLFVLFLFVCCHLVGGKLFGFPAICIAIYAMSLPFFCPLLNSI